MSLSTRIVESKDKGFVLDLKGFPPRFFTMKLVCFIGFPELLYLVLFTILLCMILMFVCFNRVHS